MAEDGWKSHLHGPCLSCAPDHWPQSTWLWELLSSGQRIRICLPCYRKGVSSDSGRPADQHFPTSHASVPTAAELIHRAEKGITKRFCTESDILKQVLKQSATWQTLSKGLLLVTEGFGTMEITRQSPVATKDTCTWFQKIPYKETEGKMVLSCPPQLSWKEKGKVGTLRGYIYLHNGGDGDDAWTMVHLQKNILPTFFLSFF